jgi:hypothetical protein
LIFSPPFGQDKNLKKFVKKTGFKTFLQTPRLLGGEAKGAGYHEARINDSCLKRVETKSLNPNR